MATFHETFNTLTINGLLQQQQNPIKCRRFALFLENNEWEAFRCAKFLIAVFRLQENQNLTTPYFQEVGGVTQHLILLS